MEPYFYRNDCDVWFKIDSNLGTCKPIFTFGRRCNNQEEAKLLTIHLNEVLGIWVTAIAEDCLFYLDPHDISELKRRLRNWHSGKDCWIR